jgi:hypothetical protein
MVSIHNESAYVRVVHDDGVVVCYVKATLVVQKLNPNVFMLKCDSLQNYYKYSDVVTPTTANIDELLALITSWNTALSNAFQSLNVSSIYFSR